MLTLSLKMEEKTLVKVSLIVGLLGVLLLHFISSGMELKAVNGLEEFEEEEEVKIAGVVGKAVEKDEVVFLDILNEKIEKVDVVLFKDKNISLSEGDYVEISGTVEEYKGEKEVIGNKVVKK